MSSLYIVIITVYSFYNVENDILKCKPQLFRAEDGLWPLPLRSSRSRADTRQRARRSGPWHKAQSGPPGLRGKRWPKCHARKGTWLRATTSPRSRPACQGACRALSLTAGPAAAGLPPWWMGTAAVVSRDQQKAGHVLLSYNNSSKVLRRPEGPHNHTLPWALAAVIMMVTAGQPRDMTGIG